LVLCKEPTLHKSPTRGHPMKQTQLKKDNQFTSNAVCQLLFYLPSIKLLFHIFLPPNSAKYCLNNWAKEPPPHPLHRKVLPEEERGKKFIQNREIQMQSEKS